MLAGAASLFLLTCISPMSSLSILAALSLSLSATALDGGVIKRTPTGYNGQDVFQARVSRELKLLYSKA